MSDAHAHALHLETSTGLDSRKVAIWTFIGSECLFFATLISNYLVNKSRNLIPPYPHDVTLPGGKVVEGVIEIPLVTFGTALLLFSSLFIVLALAGAQRGNRKALLGQYVNGRVFNAVAWGTAAVLTVLSVALIVEGVWPKG